jgi:hypothetical protein
MVFISLKPIPMVQFNTQIQHPFQANQLVYRKLLLTHIERQLWMPSIQHS